MKNVAKLQINKSSKGITLVALVITVIILIILAGITIAGLTGEKGLIKEAKTAKELTEVASLEEQIELAIIKAEQKHRNPTINDVIAELINNKVISDESKVNKETGAVHTDLGYLIEGKLDDYIGKTSTGDGNNTTGGNTTENNTTDGNTSGGGDTPTPPINNDAVPGEIVTGDENKTYTKNGIAIIPVGFAIVPGLDDVSEGLVISDDIGDTEVDSNNKIAQGNQFVWIPVTEETPYERNTTYEVVDVSEKSYDATDYLPNGITDEEQAVRRVSGFYVSRYEAGKGDSDTIIYKKDKSPFNTYQEKAIELSKTFVNNDNIKSALISGIQWDTIMNFVNGKKDGVGNVFNVTQKDDNRHRGSVVQPTGWKENDKVCNIYGLENEAEITAENNSFKSDWPVVIRGGGQWGNGAHPASYRDYKPLRLAKLYEFCFSYSALCNVNKKRK